MANFTHITFTLKTREVPDSAKLNKALDKIGRYHLKEVNANSSWGEATITGRADSRRVVEKLAKAFNGTIDELLYHFAFDCKPRVSQATLVETLRWRTFEGLKLLISESRFNSERKIIRAVGHATREEAIKELKRQIQ